MNKRIVYIALIIMLVIVGGVIYLLATPEEDKKMVRDSGTQTEQSGDNGAPNGAQPTDGSGAYVTYKDGIIAETSGTKLLFFHAPWCPQCRALDADIEEKGVPEGATIIKVDYDSNQQLRQKYGVTIQTTVVRVDDDGNLVEKFVAYDDPSLAAVVKELL